MKPAHAIELLSLSALAALPDRASEARLICEAVIAASPKGGNAHQRAMLARNLLVEQAVNQSEAQAEFTQLMQGLQGQQAFKI